jgi:hypothetical protein
VPESKNLADKNEKPLTRREELKAAGDEARLPECAADFLLINLLEIGPVVTAGMGTAAAGWRELEAWQACTGIRLPPWQARLLVELAREYHSFTHKATKPDCPAPWGEEAQTESRREAVARSLRIGFGALLSRQTKKGA